MGQILLLTSANLPTNPRLLKEIDLLKKDHLLTVILFKLGNWSDAKNIDLMHQRSEVRFILLDVTRKRFIHWLTWAILEKIARFLVNIFPSSTYLTALHLSRRSIMIKRAMKRLSKPDLIISHTLGTLYPAYYWAKKWNISFGYDAEDYDPGILVPEAGRNYQKTCESLIKKCLPHSAYITSASSLIEEYTLNLIGGHSNHQVVLNSFSVKDFKEPHTRFTTSHIQLKLVWFSQNISFNRGLEQLFAGLKSTFKQCESDTNITITLIGQMDKKFEMEIINPFRKWVEENCDQQLIIKVMPPLKQDQLHAELSNYDVGLALEPGKDLNNTLAVSNKIIAYAQAGLYILATDTIAQTTFINQNHFLGKVCGQTPHEIGEAVMQISSNDIVTVKSRQNSSNKLFCWEKEREILTSLISKQLAF